MTPRRDRIDCVYSRARLTVVMLLVLVTPHVHAYAQGTSIMVGLSPLMSKVADIPADEAQELFINALMETNQFAIRPPDASGSHAGSTYVLEPTISEAKANANVLGFLKDVATSKSPVSLTVRVFDPQTNALLKSVTVKSTDVGTAKMSVGDMHSLMSALGAGKGEQAGKREPTDQLAQLEERIGGVMQQAATRLAAQLAVGPARPAGMPRPGSARTPLTR